MTKKLETWHEGGEEFMLPPVLDEKKPRMIPKTIGEAVDMLYEVREQRYEMQRAAKQLDERETLIEKALINHLGKTRMSGAAGHKARMGTEKATRYVAENWEQFIQYVSRKKDFDLLQHRINESAVRERLENGMEIPGIGKFSYTKVHLSKIKTKE